MDQPGWNSLRRNLRKVVAEMSKIDFLDAVLELGLPILTDEDYRRLLASFGTPKDRYRDFLMSLLRHPARVSFENFCDVLRQTGLQNLSDFLQKDAKENTMSRPIPQPSTPSATDEQLENSQQLLLTKSNNPTEISPVGVQRCPASPQTPVHFPNGNNPVETIPRSQPTAAAAAACSEGPPIGSPSISISNAQTVIVGSGNVVSYQTPGQFRSVTERFNSFTPIVRTLYGKDEEREKILNRLHEYSSPVILLQGIVGIGKKSLGTTICKAHLQSLKKDSGQDTSICFMVQFPVDIVPSPLMVYQEIVVQMFGDDGLAFDGLDELGRLNVLGSLSRKIPSNSIVFMDDCENVSTPELVGAFAKALGKLMIFSDNLKVVLASSNELNLHELPVESYLLEGLSMEAAVQVLETSGIPDLPNQDKLRQIAEGCFCHPFALQMAIELLRSHGADQFFHEMIDKASPQTTGLGEHQALYQRLDNFFLRFEAANPCEFRALLELAILPGKFSLDDWKLERATRVALQGRCLLESCQSEGNIYWMVPPLLRRFATNRRKKQPDMDRESKLRCANYFCEIMKRLSSRFYSNTRSVLRELDGQRANVQFLLKCISDWSEDLKTSPELLQVVLSSMTSPGVGYMLSLRFSPQDRLKTFETLLELASNVCIDTVSNSEVLAKVYLELCYIRKVIPVDKFLNVDIAQECVDKALELFGGDRAEDMYKAQCFMMMGWIGAFDRRHNDLDNVVKTLQTARQLCKKIRTQFQSIDRERYLAWTSHLTCVVKELAFVFGKQCRYEQGLECLQKAIELSSEVLCPGHITQANLLLKSGKMRGIMAQRKPDTGVLMRKQLLDQCRKDFDRAIAICIDNGCEGHPLNGLTHSALGRTLTHLGLFQGGLKVFQEALTVLDVVGSKFQLAQVHSFRGYCYKCMGNTAAEYGFRQKCLKDENGCYEKCLEIMKGGEAGYEKFIQSTWRNLAHTHKRLGDQTKSRQCLKQVDDLGSRAHGYRLK